MRVTVLGSAQDAGLPQVGADHPLDEAARRRALPRRTASSLLVETATGRLLLDAGPDLRQQWADRRGLPDAVVLTHAHMGHYTGLVHFGEEGANTPGLPVLVTPAMATFLTSHEPWRTLVTGGCLRLSVGFDHDVAGASVRLIPVPHRGEHSDTVAISVDDALLYLPDIDSWDAWPDALEVISDHRVAFCDATFWSDDEVPGRDQAQIPHPLVPDTVTRFTDVATRIVLTHLNHTNPLCDPASPEAAEVAAAGFEVAFDGMTVSI